MDVADKLVMVPIRTIKPYQRNPRKNDVTVDKLVELIPKTGFNVPLVLDRANVIVKGHTRWRAAIRLGMKEVPAIYTDADEETIKLDRLADNRVHEFTAWDEKNLQLELQVIAPTFGPDLAALDFKLDLPDTPEPSPPPEPTPPPEPGAEPEPTPPPEPGAEPQEAASAPADPDYIEVVCNQCGERLRVMR